MSLSGQFNTRPLYQQVADEFIARIVSGVWQPGQAIENEADLARSLGISLGTVRKAFDILSEYELLERHQGKGTVVTEQVSARSRYNNIRDVNGEKVVGHVEITDVALQAPDSKTADLLAINPRTPVLGFGRSRQYNGRIFMLEIVFLRVDASVHSLAEDALQRLAESRWTNLDLATGRRETVGSCVCDAEAGERFGLPTGAPVLLLERVVSSYRGKPLELRRGLCHLGDDLVYVSA